ncbi:hypothetical protein LWI29_008719 [Acer saccharum]|uniref:Uncharacterized protein n=1 Tax=Acer saccharum TaxID=4024 RepID=A0AA39TMS6_ACESA|nr:hypothetical protein LWI29_008719 [Acer saccharum]
MDELQDELQRLPKIVRKVMANHRQVLKVSTSLPPSRHFDHRITLKDEAKPVNVSPYSPFEVMYGRPPLMLSTYDKGMAQNEEVERELVARDEVIAKVKKELEKAQGRMKKYYDQVASTSQTQVATSNQPVVSTTQPHDIPPNVTALYPLQSQIVALAAMVVPPPQNPRLGGDHTRRNNTQDLARVGDSSEEDKPLCEEEQEIFHDRGYRMKIEISSFDGYSWLKNFLTGYPQ